MSLDNDLDSCAACIEIEESDYRFNPVVVSFFVMLSVTLVMGGMSVFKRYSRAADVVAPQTATSISNSKDGSVKDGKVLAKSAIGKSVSTTDSKVDADKMVDTLAPVAITVQNKDTLIKIFKRAGLKSVRDALSILALKKARPLQYLNIGRKITLVSDTTKTKIRELSYSINDLDTLRVVPKDNGWSIKIDHIEPTIVTRYAAATISGSIYASASRAGISHKLMTKFVDIFEDKVSAYRIVNGDSFSMFYRDYTVDGKKVRNSEILAAELVHKGKTYRAIRFTDPNGVTGYYTPDGRNVKPLFVRYPLLGFKRITSSFSSSRHHPILGTIRPHLGVDFGAKTGSPVKATGSGKVIFAGSRGGYGRTVIVQRGIYRTLYAHLSGFPNNIRSGKYVSQGDVVGYVGSSGLSTSPHLHYEFRVRGVPKDPLKVKLPAGELIAARHRGSFFALSEQMLARLDLYRDGHKIFAIYPVPKTSG